MGCNLFGDRDYRCLAWLHGRSRCGRRHRKVSVLPIHRGVCDRFSSRHLCRQKNVLGDEFSLHTQTRNRGWSRSTAPAPLAYPPAELELRDLLRMAVTNRFRLADRSIRVLRHHLLLRGHAAVAMYFGLLRFGERMRTTRRNRSQRKTKRNRQTHCFHWIVMLHGAK
jgi:hypothetical protein